MERHRLGTSNIEVSRLCFGSLTMTPFQADLSIEEGAYLIRYAYERGINFLDTAEIYENYAYIREALKGISRDDFVIATKSYAYTEEMARKSLEKAMKELDTDYIDIFLLHEQEGPETIRGHLEAVEYFIKAKEEGKIRAFGISTHRVAGVRATMAYKEIQIVHPLINKRGIGIIDGSVDDMIRAIGEISQMGKGIYAMKVLAGGHLISEVEDAFSFVKGISHIDSIAIGMQSVDEIQGNIELLEKGYISDEIKERISRRRRRLIVADYCIACGRCVERCRQDGIRIEGDRAVPNKNCLLCGYCATVCPDFCIKVI